MKNKYRIVTDHYLGYEVQCKRWWLPVWIQCTDREWGCNTFASISSAEAFAKAHSNRHVIKEFYP